LVRKLYLFTQKSLEGALAHPEAYFLAGDYNLPALSGAQININNHVHTNNCHIIRWDVRKLPLRDGIVDIIISDLPFGHKHGTYATLSRYSDR
jgi:tRNA G10  N-methylase Trm11